MEAQDSDLKEVWQQRFASMDEAGLQNYKEFAAKLKALPREEQQTLWIEATGGFNWPAFLFGPYYYFAKKMYHKGGILLAFGLLLGVILDEVLVLFGAGTSTYVEFFNMLWICLGVVMGFLASYDYYRSVRLNEKMWSYMPSFLSTDAGVYGSIAVVVIMTMITYDQGVFAGLMACLLSGMWGLYHVSLIVISSINLVIDIFNELL